MNLKFNRFFLVHRYICDKIFVKIRLVVFICKVANRQTNRQLTNRQTNEGPGTYEIQTYTNFILDKWAENAQFLLSSFCLRISYNKTFVRPAGAKARAPARSTSFSRSFDLERPGVTPLLACYRSVCRMNSTQNSVLWCYFDATLLAVGILSTCCSRCFTARERPMIVQFIKRRIEKSFTSHSTCHFEDESSSLKNIQQDRNRDQNQKLEKKD